MSKKNIIFHHNYLINNWINILKEQITELKNSGLYDACDNIIATIYSEYIDNQNRNLFKEIIKNEDTSNKWIIVELYKNNYEYEILKIIKNYCDYENENINICYFHTKGVCSEQIKQNIGLPSWRKYLNYFIINKWKDNIEKLKDYDVVSVDYDFNQYHNKHIIGGNFFWSKSEYIKKLSEPQYSKDRFYYDSWISSYEKCKIFENFNCLKLGYNLYLQNLPESVYKESRMNELLKERRLPHLGDDNGINRLFGLKDLITENLNKDSIVCEIGSFEGKSSELFALLVKSVYCVDPWDLYHEIGDEFMSQSENKFDDVLKRYNNIIKIKNFSVDVSKTFENEFFDCVYIDGDHNYEPVKQDIQHWIPKVKNGGFISGHDYNLWGIRKAIDETFKDVPIRVYSDQSWIIKIEHKNPVIVMTSHPNFKTSEEITKQSLESLNPLNIDTILSTHCPVSQNLQNTATHFIFDKNNPLIRHDYYEQSWFDKEEYYALIKLHKNDNDLQHALSVYINYYNGILHARSLGYTKAICTNFDIVFDKEDLNIITSKMNEMNSTGKKAFFMTSNANEGIHYKTIFFITDIDFFIENFKYVTNENDYNLLTREVGSETNCLENFFYQTLKNSDKLLLQQVNEGDLFSKSKVNLFSNIEYFTILPLKGDSENFVVWFSSSNSFDDNRNLTIKVFDETDCIYVKNDLISKNYVFFKKIKFERHHKYLIYCQIKYNEMIKEKQIIIENESFDKLNENGEFWDKMNNLNKNEEKIKDINFIIQNSKSQSGQDIFAYYMCETNNGYFLDFGSQGPIQINNTYLLEKMGWDGISFDIQNQEYQMRKSKFICCDLTSVDINKILEDNKVPKLIDYISIDIDDDTEKFIFNFPFDKYEFKVMTLEHDSYKNGIDSKNKYKKLLLDKGYSLVCNDVCVESKDVMTQFLNDSNLYPFEDWYINNKYINKNKINIVLSDNMFYGDIIKKLI